MVSIIWWIPVTISCLQSAGLMDQSFRSNFPDLLMAHNQLILMLINQGNSAGLDEACDVTDSLDQSAVGFQQIRDLNPPWRERGLL